MREEEVWYRGYEERKKFRTRDMRRGKSSGPGI
jgi:hypothetical protein